MYSIKRDTLTRVADAFSKETGNLYSSGWPPHNLLKMTVFYCMVYITVTVCNDKIIWFRRVNFVSSFENRSFPVSHPICIITEYSITFWRSRVQYLFIRTRMKCTRCYVWYKTRWTYAWKRNLSQWIKLIYEYLVYIQSDDRLVLKRIC